MAAERRRRREVMSATRVERAAGVAGGAERTGSGRRLCHAALQIAIKLQRLLKFDEFIHLESC